MILFFFEVFIKTSSWVLRVFFHTGGETWPGELLLRSFPDITKQIAHCFDRTIYVVGTNGKTSTSKLVREMLRHEEYALITNPSGANLLNGLVTNFFLQKFFLKNTGYVAVFEVDEYAFSKVLTYFPPTYVIILNLVRDQLDRYGEVSAIMERWSKALSKYSDYDIIAQAYDPAVYYLVESLENVRKHYFGIPELYLHKTSEVLGDFIYCPVCGNKFVYEGQYVSHIGKWKCTTCKRSPKNPVIFNEKLLKNISHLSDYLVINSQAVYLLAQLLRVPEINFLQSLTAFKPAFGRGESIRAEGVNYTFYLGKNPASWTVALENCVEKNQDAEIVIFGLNNRVPDGHDVSWIWDIAIRDPLFFKNKKIVVFGDRCYDMAQRLKTENINVHEVFEQLDELKKNLEMEKKDRVVLLCNYSALLEARRVFIGRAIPEF